MKKQLMTGALTLTMMMGTMGMAMAAGDVLPAVETVSAQAIAVSTVEMGMIQQDDSVKMTMKKAKLYTAEQYEADLIEMKDNLAVQVVEGTLTQAEADRVLAQMNETLGEMKAGAIEIYQVERVNENGEVTGVVCFTDEVNLLDAETIEMGKLVNAEVKVAGDILPMTNVTITK